MRSPRKFPARFVWIAFALALVLAGSGHAWAQNAPPVITAPATVTAQEGVFFSVTITAISQDPSRTVIMTGPSPSCGISFSSSPGVGQATGTLSGTPAYDCAGIYAVTITASDGVSIASTTIQLTIVNTDRAPVVTAPANKAIPENSLLSFTVTAIDPDGDAIASFTAASSPPTLGSTFTAGTGNTSGTFSWIPTFTQAGSYTVTFTAVNALSGSASTMITVCNTCERAPVVTAPSTASGLAETLISFTVSATDPDGDAIVGFTASGTAISAGGTFVTGPMGQFVSGTFSWTPTLGQEGTYSATFLASNALSGSAATQITVGDRAPIVTAPASVLAPVGEARSFVVTATDPDGDAITSLTAAYSASVPGPTSFTTNASNTSGTFTWTPSIIGFSFTVTFTASNVLSGSAQTTLNSCDCAFILMIAPASISGAVESPITFTVSAVDPGGKAITSFTASGSAISSGGSFATNATLTSGTFSWTPTTTQAGTYSVTFNASNSFRIGILTTQITVSGGVAQARAFTTNSSKTIKLSSGKPQWCVHIEPVSGFQLSDIQLGTVVMRSPGTGSVSEIPAIAGKTNVQGDADNNGIDDAEFCFMKGNLQLLFSNLSGRNTVNVTIAGRLMSGSFFEAPLSVDVNAGGGGNPVASITPNPLNPSGMLSFGTTRSGVVRVRLFDSGGRLVRTVLDTALPAGQHEVPLEAKNAIGSPLASGVYFFRVEAPGDVMTGRFVVAK